ncbi:unnamed protein product [Staurois parvus]|uniref:Uncharacterized protein n=1 Tax=Staurois parvus TaxID=386267 RepID=A0ABN9AAH4_9NEOB|nr:unnamed protein product [Staurois parvus]
MCRAIQSSLFVLKGDRSVLFTYRPLPCQLCRRFSIWDPVIDMPRSQ